MDVLFLVNCTNPEQECVLLQPDDGVDDNDETTTSKAQAGARKEFTDCRLVGNNERRLRLSKASNLIPERDGGAITFLPTDFAVVSFVRINPVFFSRCIFGLVQNFPKQVREARIIFTGCESNWYANRMHELLHQDRSVHRHLDLRQRKVYSVPHYSFVRLMICAFVFDTANDRSF